MKILFEKDTTTTKHYKYTGMTEILTTFGRYKGTRERDNVSVQKKCFSCEKPFVNEENLSVLMNGNNKNKLICEDCATKIKGE